MDSNRNSDSRAMTVAVVFAAAALEQPATSQAPEGSAQDVRC